MTNLSYRSSAGRNEAVQNLPYASAVLLLLELNVYLDLRNYPNRHILAVALTEALDPGDIDLLINEYNCAVNALKEEPAYADYLLGLAEAPARSTLNAPLPRHIAGTIVLRWMRIFNEVSRGQADLFYWRGMDIFFGIVWRHLNIKAAEVRTKVSALPPPVRLNRF